MGKLSPALTEHVLIFSNGQKRQILDPELQQKLITQVDGRTLQQNVLKSQNISIRSPTNKQDRKHHHLGGGNKWNDGWTDGRMGGCVGQSLPNNARAKPGPQSGVISGSRVLLGSFLMRHTFCFLSGSPPVHSVCEGLLLPIWQCCKLFLSA